MDPIFIVVTLAGKNLWLIDTRLDSTLVGAFPSELPTPTALAWDGSNLYCVDVGDELWIIDRTTPGNSTLVGAFPSGLGSPPTA